MTPPRIRRLEWTTSNSGSHAFIHHRRVSIFPAVATTIPAVIVIGPGASTIGLDGVGYHTDDGARRAVEEAAHQWGCALLGLPVDTDIHGLLAEFVKLRTQRNGFSPPKDAP